MENPRAAILGEAFSPSSRASVSEARDPYPAVYR
jgi:hypothetical protein